MEDDRNKNFTTSNAPAGNQGPRKTVFHSFKNTQP
jgi:hypothetical protein